MITTASFQTLMSCMRLHAAPMAGAMTGNEAGLPLLLRAALIVYALNAGRAIGARDDAHSILGGGMSAPAGLGSFHTVLIRL